MQFCTNRQAKLSLQLSFLLRTFIFKQQTGKLVLARQQTTISNWSVCDCSQYYFLCLKIVLMKCEQVYIQNTC